VPVRPDLAELVERLESPVDAPDVTRRLIAAGAAAVEPLRRYLLSGRILSVFEPRRRAVDILAALGARDVLLEYLEQGREVQEPVLRLSEDAVEGAAARALAAWPDDEVFGAVLRRTQHRLLPGLVEALGRLRRPEALPLLLQALEDDLCRRGAEEALAVFGPSATAALIEAASSPSSSGDRESPSSLGRRRSAAALLAGGLATAEHWPALRSLLLEEDPGLLVAAARLATRFGTEADRELAASTLISLAEVVTWPLSLEIEDGLVDLLPQARAVIEQEVRRLEARLEPPPSWAREHLPAAAACSLLRRVLRRGDSARASGQG